MIEQQTAATARSGWWEEVQAGYMARTPGSRAAFQRNLRRFPGGAPGGLGYLEPYPLYVDRGAGCHIWDVDGNEYIDTFFGDWLLIMGHVHPGVTAAVKAQLDLGTTFGQPQATIGYELATLICERLPSVERLRFTTSGSEATQAALRLARAFTGRHTVAKMRGGYHGTHDVSLIANGRFPDADAVPPGLIPGTVEHTLLLPFNDPEACEAAITAHAKDLAAVIVEPVLGGSGMVPGTTEFLTCLREATERVGALLIFDEVVTFPVGPHGAQGLHGITPDLTTVGKAISGGLPLGAFGGRAEVMDLIDPVLDPMSDYRHASTLGGAPVALAAGLAQVRHLTPEVHAHLQRLGDRLRSGVDALGARLGVPLQSSGLGHLYACHWTSVPVTDFDSVLTSDRRLMSQLALAMGGDAIFQRASGNGIVSAATDDAAVDAYLSALEHAIVDAGLAA